MVGLANVKDSKWDYEICEKLSIAIEKLPIILKPYRIVGTINKSKFNTLKDIEVMVGLGDQIASYIGSGTINDGDLVDVAGTYTVLSYCTNEFKPDLKRIFNAIYSGVENIYYQIAVIAAGGYTYEWFIKTFKYKRRNKYDFTKHTAGLFFIPYFGGRYYPAQPYYDGSWLGIKWKHEIDDFYLSILESFAYEFYANLCTLKKLNNLPEDYFKKIVTIHP